MSTLKSVLWWLHHRLCIHQLPANSIRPRHANHPLLQGKETSTHVEAVRLGIESDEAARLAAHRERSERIAGSVDEERQRSTVSLGALTKGWAALLESTLPDELDDGLLQQRTMCGELLASRDKLIETLQLEVKARDEGYLQELSSQRDARQELVRRMHAQYDEALTAREDKLMAIEAKFLEDRTELMGAHKREIDQLLEQRRGAEIKIVEDKLERERAQAKELADMQAIDAENYQVSRDRSSS